MTDYNNILKSKDYDRFFLANLEGEEIRKDITTLLHFNAELAKIKSIVSEEMLGMIRFQWWRDMINSGSAQGGELFEAVNFLINKYEIPKELFITLINAREQELSPEPFADINSFKDYIKNSDGQLNEIALYILKKNSEENIITAKRIGAYYGFVKILCLTHFNFGNGKFFLPKDVFRKYKIENLEKFDEEFFNSAKLAIQELSEEVTGARIASNTLPKFISKQKIIADYYLKQIVKSNFEVLKIIPPQKPSPFILIKCLF
jgi:phytoene synthase